MRSLQILTLCLLVCRVAEAQDSVGLYELLDASTQHPSVQLNQNEAVVAGYRLDAAEWARYPSFTADASAPIGSEDSLTLRVEQPIWTGGRVHAVISAAKQELAVSSSRVDEAIDAIQLEVIDAYVELWRAQRKFAASEQNVSALTELLGVITRRVNQEVSPRSEQVLAQARLQQAVSEREQYIGAMAMSRSRLLQATNRPVENVLDLACDIPKQASRDALVERVLNNSSRIARLRGEYNVALANVEVTETERWPKLVFGVQSSSVDGLLARRDTRAYLSFQYQLVDGLSGNAKLAASQNALQSVRFEEQVAQQQIRQQISSYFDDYRMSSAQIPTLLDLSRANVDLIDSYRRQYIVGKKSWLDVINAQREVSVAQNLLVDAEVNSCANALRLQLLSDQEFVKERRG